MKTIKLQGIGNTMAVEVQQLSVGDVTVWNFGSLAEVVGFNREAETKCFRVVILKSEGEEYERRMKKDRLVGLLSTEKEEKEAQKEVMEVINREFADKPFTFGGVMTHLVTRPNINALRRAFWFFRESGKFIVTESAGWKEKTRKLQIADRYELAESIL